MKVDPRKCLQGNILSDELYAITRDYNQTQVELH